MKTLFYDEAAIINLKMFGIEIPALKSRKTGTIEALMKIEALSSTKDRWLITDNPYSMEKTDFYRIHGKDYVETLFSDNPEICLYEAYELLNGDGTWNRYDPRKAEAPLTELVAQVLRTCAGTYFAAREALKSGFCYFLGGGMHHGHRDFGHGFCPTNDIMAAAARILSEKRANSIWIIDVDAHKGDGTAEMAALYKEIKTLSIHMAEGWPLDKPEYDGDGNFNPAWFPSDIDIPVKAGEEGQYNQRLLEGLEELAQLTDNGAADLAIVLLGSDPYEKDELDSTKPLRMTEEQLLERDLAILRFLEKRNIPAAYTMAGGYGKESWRIHYNFLKEALLND